MPYEKGRLFFNFLDGKFGREHFDAFLRGYFDHFAFKSITTEQFLEYLKENLLDRFPGIVSRDQVLAWVKEPGLPPDARCSPSIAFEPVDAARSAWLAGKLPAKKFGTGLGDAAMAVFSRRYAGAAAQGAAGRSRSGVRLHAQPRTPRSTELVRAGDQQRLSAELRASRGVLEDHRPPQADRTAVHRAHEDAGGEVLAKRVYALARPGYQAQTAAALDAIVNSRLR